MADNGNPEDLVSKVTVTGTEESTAKLDAYAASGAAAFDKLDKAAKKSSDDIKRSSKGVENAAASAQQALGGIGNTRIGRSITPDLKQIELGAKNLVQAVRSGIPAIASFVARLTAAGTAAAAAGVGILKLASNVAKGTTTQVSALDRQTEAQINANNSQLAATQSGIQYEATQRKLLNQLQLGQISFSDYSDSLQQLAVDYREQTRVANELENAQQSVRLENERLQKQAADQKAFNALIDTWGGPMLTALRALGTQADLVFNKFKQTFGPAAASGLDTITAALSKNGQAISDFFDRAAAKLSEFINNNGPAIELAFQNIGRAISTVFDGLISALPGLLSFFNNSLVPAIEAFGVVLSGIASTINTIFGTQLTGGALVFLVILGQMTGAFVALINVIRIFGAVASIIIGLPFGGVFLAIVATIGVLLFLFPQLRGVALDVLTAIINAFRGMSAGAQSAVQSTIRLFRGMLAFFQGLPEQITTFFAQMWTDIVAGVMSAVQLVIASWGAFTTFLQGLPGQVNQFFVDMGTQVLATVDGWVQQTIEFFADLLGRARQFLQPIIDMLRAIASLSTSAVGGGGGPTPVTAAGGGIIRGPGTPTSDSIPAWLSDSEFVIRAKAVRKYGVAFMNAINQGTFRMPKFSFGGLNMIQPMPRAHFADGGPVSSGSSMRPLNLSLFGEEFNGLMMPDDVANRMTKFAITRQTRSAGRKPAWVGGTR